jgi:uncharacterized protein YdeI (YjbR/CyaY-like superfamily)
MKTEKTETKGNKPNAHQAKAIAELPVHRFDDQKAWAAWLGKNGKTAPGLWLKLAKQGTEPKSLTYDEALEVALCFGWIDGQKKSFDASAWLQKFTPRGPKSIWSKINCRKAEALLAGGKMKPAGLKAVEAAKADGRWDAAYDSQRTGGIPADFQAALDSHPKAKAFFATINSANRYAFLFRIQTAKKPETRAKRIRQFIEMLEQHKTFH